MSQLAYSILAGIAREEDRLRKLAETTLRYDLPIAEKTALSDFDAGYGVRIDFASWTGEPATPANRQRHHRELLRLECAGLVRLAARWQGRTTHASLTKSGREALR